MKKLVLITGSTGGLGSHIAKQAIKAGYDVVGLARRKPEADLGFPVLLADVGDPNAVAVAFRELRKLGVGSFWAIINAAGIGAMNLMVMTPPGVMGAVVATNLLGTMYCSAEAARLLLRSKAGRIINFSSIAPTVALAGESVYAASKAGVEAFSRCTARELAPFGITVNCIAPGPIETNILRGLTPGQIDAVVQKQILTRMGTVEDVWNSVAFLLSEASGMISGQTLHVGGA